MIAPTFPADLPDDLDSVARTRIRNNGTLVGARRAINFHAGTDMLLTLADDSINEETDITITLDVATLLAALAGAGLVVNGSALDVNTGDGTLIEPQLRGVVLDGVNDFASVPDAAGYSALSDMSILWCGTTSDWAPGATRGLFSQYMATGNQRSWSLQTPGGSGVLQFATSTNGSSANNKNSTVATGFTANQFYWILVTRAASTDTAKFYTAPFADSPLPPVLAAFTQLGANVVGGGTGALFDSTSTLSVGARGSAGANPLPGTVYRAQLYSGIYGSGSETLLVDFDPTNDTSSTSDTTWSEGTYTWTLNNGAVLTGGAAEAVGVDFAITDTTTAVDQTLPANFTGLVVANPYVVPSGKLLNIEPNACLVLETPITKAGLAITEGLARTETIPRDSYCRLGGGIPYDIRSGMSLTLTLGSCFELAT